MLPDSKILTHKAVSYVNQAYKENDLKDIRILLVDDAADNLFLFRRFLERAGAEVEHAENGREAIERAENGNHHIILMDIEMPVMDGLEATAILRSRAFSKPILALTAHVMKEDRNRFLEVGFNAHIPKPIDPVELVKTVRSHVGATFF